MRYFVELLVVEKPHPFLNLKEEFKAWIKIKNRYPMIINGMKFKLGEIKEEGE